MSNIPFDEKRYWEAYLEMWRALENFPSDKQQELTEIKRKLRYNNGIRSDLELCERCSVLEEEIVQMIGRRNSPLNQEEKQHD